MTSFITYLLQSAVLIAVLFSVYWLFLRKDTFFHVNRIYLLSSVVLSLFIPLLDINFNLSGSESPVMIMLDPVLISSERIERVTAEHISWFEIAGVIYLTGVFIFSIRFMVQLIQLFIIIRRNKITRHEGANIVFVDRGYSPFSFFNLIFIRKEYYVDDKLTPVLAHENIHIRQYHTLDLILVEIAIILQWFNPFAWFIGQSLKSIHEFLADEGVLKKGFLKNEYQTLILNEAMGLQVNNLTNNFNVSLIKNRIKMMTKTRSSSWTLIKVMVALPAFFAVLFFFTAGAVSNLSAQDKQQQKVKQAQETKAENPVFQVVEVMPEYPGGQQALYTYIATNIKYPAEAKTNNIKGTVYITYIIEKDGSVSNVEIKKGIGGGCDEESARVIKGMPKWSPGLQEGKPVRVQFTLPIKFNLDDGGSKSEGEEKK